MDIVIIGTGRLGSFLARKFSEKGHNIIGLYNRNIAKAQILANELGCNFYRKIELLPQNADFYFLTVKDSVIHNISLNPFFKDKTLVHCSGALPLKTISSAKHYGVFYPLQTFATDPEKIPILIEADSKPILKKLEELAKSVSSLVYHFDSNQRKVAHIAAVFANNFGNHLFYIAKEILDENKLPSEIIEPLIEQTSKNAIENDPLLMQTGPAIRNDKNTIEKHIKFLRKHHKDFQKVYKILTKSIKKTYKNELVEK